MPGVAGLGEGGDVDPQAAFSTRYRSFFPTASTFPNETFHASVIGQMQAINMPLSLH